MKKIAYILGVIALGLVTGTLIFWFNMAKNVTPPAYEIYFDEEKISFSGGSWETEVLPPYLPDGITKIWTVKVDIAADAMLSLIKTTGPKHSVKCDFPYLATVKNEGGQVVYEGENIDESTAFTQSGSYTLDIVASLPKSDKYRGNGQLYYSAMIEIDNTPTVTYSNTSPLQGEIVKVEVSNVVDGQEVSVNSETFKPSAVYYDKQAAKAMFYLPITYYKDTGAYNITVQVQKGEEKQSFEQTITVQPFEFSTIRFTVDEDTTASTVNSAAANKEYREKIHPLYYTKDSQLYWASKLVKPVEEKKISSQFGQKRYVNNSKTPERHSGIDYAAPLGTPVYAAAQGKVEFAGFLALSGNTVVIEHGLGLKSYYFHMDSLNVSTGDMVNQSQQIGAVGTTGYSTGPHLHFQVSIENQPVNPELLY